MATQAQLDEKARKDRMGVAPPSSLEGMATPAQLAEKSRQDQAGVSTYATPAQMAEKSRQDQSGMSSYATPAQLAEKSRQDELGFSSYATPAQLAEKSQRTGAPALPPRIPSVPPPPAYSADDQKRSELISEQWRSNDPRSSSTHSLVPSESGRDGRRTLLLVYIHGFMGNETSFQSFPAHVHNLLTITLEETHIVHTKIYPRYKSRKAIDFARDDFSIWLEPHENHYTEVVLLGHSMGGILSAEVALQKPESPATGKPFRHRILGTISFDTPFLGMHPGVVVSGIGSLFRPAPEPPGAKARQASTSGTNTPSMDSQASISSQSYATSIADSEHSSQMSLVQSITSPLASPPPRDPFFNPPFPNDVRLPERKGWSNLLHFINKHSDGLTSATKQYFMSHLEFGGCLADYPGLKNRYEKLRGLEDVDDLAQRNRPGYQAPIRRVRFVNYYTASTGRPKAPKPPPEMKDADGNPKPIEVEMQDMTLTPAETQSSSTNRSPGSTPRISVDEHGDGAITPQPLEDAPGASPIEAEMQNLGENSGVHDDFQEPPEMMHIDSIPIEDDEDDLYSAPKATPKATTEPTDETLSPIKSTPTEAALPPIPPEPTEPEPIDLSVYTDKDSRKIAEKEQKRITKVYQQAVKDRESAIKDRKNLIEKRRKKAEQERDKHLKTEEKQRLKEQEKQLKAEEKQRLKEEKEEEKRRLREEKEEEKRKATINPEPPRERQTSVTASESTSSKSDKPKRDKKFCMLPPEYGGKRDKCWIRVYMEGVDEVGAHCGLFFPGPQYESLVGDVGDRIGKWVEEDSRRRAMLDT